MASSVNSGSDRNFAAFARGEKVASRVARQIVRDIVERDMQPGDPLQPESGMI
jgi:DNA-binding FadR family transcriptional regulator